VTNATDPDELLAAAGNTFGLPDALTTGQAQRLADALETGWRAAYGDLAVLNKDLQKTRRFFDPVAQGQRLREAIASLPPLDSFPAAMPVELVIRVGSGRVLVTPEGRCAIDLLRRDAKISGEAVFLPVAAVRRYEAELLRLYRDWGRHRLRQVIALLAGEDKPLQLPAAGVVLVLLVNRSTSPDRAIQKRTDSARQLIDEAFFAAVYRFADAFGISERRDRRKEGLVKGWTIGEVRRRFDELLVSDSDLLYLPEEHRDTAITRLASELARRRDVDEAHIAAGFDALVAELRDRVSVFASYGMAHERTRDTAQLRAALLAAFRAARHT
jgi:hypothetical protein